MNPAMYRRYRELLHLFPPQGERILEIGATAKLAESLLALAPQRYRVGVNIRVQSGSPNWQPMLMANANRLPFLDNSFDAVVCNAVLEHDRRFWETIREVRRVLRTGGLFYVGVPAYARRHTKIARVSKVMYSKYCRHRMVILRTFGCSRALGRLIATPTYLYHSAPDYYRYSIDGFIDVLLEGFEPLSVEYVHRPVRLLGVGRLIGE